MFFVYVLKSQKDHKFYIGQTNNILSRICRHNEGRVKSTKHRIPFILVYSEKYTTRNEAMAREKYLKSLKGNSVFKKIIGM
jgi:putative endonuclease